MNAPFSLSTFLGLSPASSVAIVALLFGVASTGLSGPSSTPPVVGVVKNQAVTKSPLQMEGVRRLKIIASRLELIVRTTKANEKPQIITTPPGAAKVQLRRDGGWLELTATPSGPTRSNQARLELHVPVGLEVYIENSNAPVSVEGALSRLEVMGDDMDIKVVGTEDTDLDLRGKRSAIELFSVSGRIHINTSEAPVKINYAINAVLEVMASSRVDINVFQPRVLSHNWVITRSGDINLSGLKTHGEPMLLNAGALNGGVSLRGFGSGIYSYAKVLGKGIETKVSVNATGRPTMWVRLETTNASIHIEKEEP